MTSFSHRRRLLRRLARFDNICLALSALMCAAMVAMNLSIWSAS